MKKIVIFLFFSYIIQFVYSQDFRKSEWGDSQEKVMTTETGKPIEKTKDHILYSTKIAGMDAIAIYFFIENKLVQGGYAIALKHSNDNLYYQDYIQFQKLLVEKYGDFVQEENIWSDNTFRNDPGKIGFALMLGYVQLITVWETEKGIITLGTHSDNLSVVLFINYKSLEYKDLIEKKGTEGL